MCSIMSIGFDHHAVAGGIVESLEQFEVGHESARADAEHEAAALMWSNCAASAATIAGWWFGRLMTAVPNVMCLVR